MSKQDALNMPQKLKYNFNIQHDKASPGPGPDRLDVRYHLVTSLPCERASLNHETLLVITLPDRLILKTKRGLQSGR